MSQENGPRDGNLQDDLDKLLELQRRPEAADTVKVIVDTMIDTIDARARELHAEAGAADREGNDELAATLRAKIDALNETADRIREQFAPPPPGEPA